MKKLAANSDESTGLTRAEKERQRFLADEAKRQAAPQVVKPEKPEKKKGKDSGKKAKAQGKSVSTPATSRRATFVAVAFLVFVVGYMIFSFVSTPEGQQFVSETVMAEQVTVTDTGGGDFECPAGITKLEFDSRGVLQPPYPTLAEQPQRFCFSVAMYERFLGLTGALEDSGEEITGLQWLAKTISYPDWADLFDEVTASLTNVTLATNMETVGWIELPGTSGHQSQPNSVPNPGVNPNWNTSVVPMPADPQSTPRPTAAPTATPMPTVAFAAIPTLVPMATVTPLPHVEALHEDIRSETISDEKMTAYQNTCVRFLETTDIADLRYSEAWQYTDMLELGWDEWGVHALGKHIGGNGPDAFKRSVCILQLTGFNWGGSIDHGGGIVSQPDWAQVRLVPLYGPGDGKSNGKECYWLGLWHFPCTTTYPEAIPSPTPLPLPTSTPMAGYGSFADYVQIEWVGDPNADYGDLEYSWEGTPKYWARSCPGYTATSVRFIYGGVCNGDGPSHLVNISDIWELLDTSGDIFVVRCGHPSQPEGVASAELGSTGVCFGPIR